MKILSSNLAPFYLLICVIFIALPLKIAAQPVCPSNDDPGTADCEFACLHCDLNGYQGSNAAFGPDPDGDIQFCTGVENGQWLGFVAHAASMTITITPSGCTNGNGLDVGLFPSCDHAPLMCMPGTAMGGSTPINLTFSGYTVGASYLLFIDGYQGDVCSFSISVNPPNGTTPFPPVVHGPLSVCPKETAVYTVDHLTPTPNYLTWTAPPGTLINGMPSPVDLFDLYAGVTVTWGNVGGQLCVAGGGDCSNLQKTCKNVTVAQIPPTIYPPEKVCFENLPYELPWGTAIVSSGLYVDTLQSDRGCDSIFKQQVIVYPQILPHTVPRTALCPDDCTTVCGEEFCDPGDYTLNCKSIHGCDSTVSFSIVKPNADILNGPTVLSCTQTTLTLHAAAVCSFCTKRWLNSGGLSLGITDSLNVTSPGIYILEVKALGASNFCTVRDTVVVTANTLAPSVTATGDSINCKPPPFLAHANTPVAPAQFAWTGPNGFLSTLQNPVITDTGLYTVKITNPANGCTNTATVPISACCTNKAGTLDSLPVFACGMDTVSILYHGDAVLYSNDVIRFILFSNHADPLGSILAYNSTPNFNFIPGVTQYDSTYYVAVLAGVLLPDSSKINLADKCFTFSIGPTVLWRSLPTVAVAPAPNVVCQDGCIAETFSFTGSAPFHFTYRVTQNGQVLYTKNEISNTNQKTVMVCPADFNPPAGSGPVTVEVTYLDDVHCSCAH